MKGIRSMNIIQKLPCFQLVHTLQHKLFTVMSRL